MEVEERVQHIEGELTLIKGEIQQTLVELRDMVTKRGIEDPETGRTVFLHQMQNVAGDPNTPPRMDRSPDGDAPDQPQDQAQDELDEDGTLEQDNLDQPEAHQQDLGLEDAGQPPSEASLELDSTTYDLIPDQDQQPFIEFSEPDGTVSFPAIPGSPPVEIRALDIHSVANLLRWVGAARPRIGENQLGTLLEIYQLTGHLPASIEQLILQAAKLDAIADTCDQPGFTLEEYVDALLKLHAMVSSLQYRGGGNQQGLLKPPFPENGGWPPGDGSHDSPFVAYGPSLDQGQQATIELSSLQRDARTQDGSGGGLAGAGTLDANLVANLIRWACVVRPSIGEEQLGILLQVYRLTGNLPPTAECLLLLAAKLEAVLDGSTVKGYTLNELIDSLLKLHGIVHSTEIQPPGLSREFGQPPTVTRDRHG